MENKTGIIQSIITKTKQDGGKSYVVDVKHGNDVVKYLCYDGKIMEKKAGEEVTFLADQKDYGLVMFFPKAKAVTGGGGGRSDFQAKLNAILQTHTMPMSYAKDAVRDMYSALGIQASWPLEDIPNDAIEKRKSTYMVDLLTIYQALRGEILADKNLTGLLGISTGQKADVKPQSISEAVKQEKPEATKRKPAAKKPAKQEPESTTEKPVQAEPESPCPVNLTGIHKEFETAIMLLLEQVLSKGYLLPPDIEEKICYRLTQQKAEDGSLLPGIIDIADMNEAQAKMAFDRFQMFQYRECPCKIEGCRYHKATADDPNFCSWVLTCLYQKKAEEI